MSIGRHERKHRTIIMEGGKQYKCLIQYNRTQLNACIRVKKSVSRHEHNGQIDWHNEHIEDGIETSHRPTFSPFAYYPIFEVKVYTSDTETDMTKINMD